MVNSPAGFWIRLGASFLDGIIISIPVTLLGLAVGLSFDESDSMNSIISGLYFLFLPVLWYGYTVGKKICGIRIARLDGEKVGIGTMLLRYVIGKIIVYGFTFGVAAIVSAFMVGIRQDKRALHDFIASTYVTHEEPE